MAKNQKQIVWQGKAYRTFSELCKDLDKDTLHGLLTSEHKGINSFIRDIFSVAEKNQNIRNIVEYVTEQEFADVTAKSYFQAVKRYARYLLDSGCIAARKKVAAGIFTYLPMERFSFQTLVWDTYRQKLEKKSPVTYSFGLYYDSKGFAISQKVVTNTRKAEALASYRAFKAKVNDEIKVEVAVLTTLNNSLEGADNATRALLMEQIRGSEARAAKLEAQRAEVLEKLAPLEQWEEEMKRAEAAEAAKRAEAAKAEAEALAAKRAEAEAKAKAEKEAAKKAAAEAAEAEAKARAEAEAKAKAEREKRKAEAAAKHEKIAAEAAEAKAKAEAEKEKRKAEREKRKAEQAA